MFRCIRGHRDSNFFLGFLIFFLNPTLNFLQMLSWIFNFLEFLIHFLKVFIRFLKFGKKKLLNIFSIFLKWLFFIFSTKKTYIFFEILKIFLFCEDSEKLFLFQKKVSKILTKKKLFPFPTELPKPMSLSRSPETSSTHFRMLFRIQNPSSDVERGNPSF